MITLFISFIIMVSLGLLAWFGMFFTTPVDT